jgi:hypothetical protein
MLPIRSLRYYCVRPQFLFLRHSIMPLKHFIHRQRDVAHISLNDVQNYWQDVLNYDHEPGTL